MSRSKKQKRDQVQREPARLPELSAATVLHKNQNLWLSLILLTFSFLLYANTLKHGFALDDAAVISENKLVQQGAKAIPELWGSTLFSGMETVRKDSWRPLPMISFALELELLGSGPSHFHLFNVLLYALSIFLLFFLLTELAGKDKAVPAFAVCLLFAAHPIHTEVVANIKSRDEILGLLLMIPVAWTGLLYLRKKNIGWLAAACVAFFACLLCKESAMTFILAIPLLLYFFTDVPMKKYVFLTACLLGTGLLYLLIRASVLGSLNFGEEVVMIDNVIVQADMGERLGTAFHVLGRYMTLLLLPFQLSYDYSFNQIPLTQLTDIGSLLAMLVCLVAVAWGLYGLKSRNRIALGVLFFFVTISVVSNILFLTGTVMAERLLFIPSLGFCLLLVYGLVKISKSREDMSASEMPARIVFFIPLLLLTLFYSFKTYSRNPVWKDSMSLFRSDVKHAPKSARAHYNLGNVLWKKSVDEKDPGTKNRILQEAGDETQAAINIYPSYPQAIMTMANIYHELGQFDKEMQLLSTISSTQEDDGTLAFIQGNALAAKGDYRGSLQLYHQAMAEGNRVSDLFTGVAVSYNGLGMHDSAIVYCNKALEADPASSGAYITLGSSYSALHKEQNAIDAFRKAIAIKPDAFEAWINMGNSYLNLKDFKQAEEALQKGVELRPALPEAHYNLANCLMVQQKYNPAIGLFLKALELRPDYAECYMNLGYIAIIEKRFNDGIQYYEKGLAIAPGMINGYNGIALCYEMIGDKAKAMEWRQKAAALGR